VGEAFLLVLRAREEPDDPGLWPLCRVPLVVRSAIAAVRSGAGRIAVLGAEATVEAAGALLAADHRLRGCPVDLGHVPAWDGAVVEVPTDAVIPPALMKRLAHAEGDVCVPGVPEATKRCSAAHPGPLRPLWDGATPAGCFAMRIRARRDLRTAKGLLLRHARARSSPVSRWLNEHVSLRLNWVLAETPVTPNQITVLNTLVGVAGAAFVAMGSMASLAAGGVMLQLTSVLDCSDGELARCKLMESAYGAWIDTVGDNVIYAAYALGLTIGYTRFAHALDVPWMALVMPLGFGTLALAALLIGGMFHYVRSRGLGGSLSAVSKDFESRVEGGAGGWARKLFEFLTVMGRRAQFTFAFAVVAVLPILTGDARFFHGIFFAMVGFVLIANVYFGMGLWKARGVVSGHR
jgi:phosphatidylglycerophosphate synthase